MADNKKQQRQNLKDYIRQELGDQLSQEVRELIDLAVRKQYSLQQFTTRYVNTKQFRRQFPGLIERGGEISNALVGGAENVEVGPGSLQTAIKAYDTALGQFQNEARAYGYSFNKHQFAATIKNQTSLKEFQDRLKAVDAVDSNPEMLAAFNQQAKMQGLKTTKQNAYQAAVKAGDTRFQDIYEATQYQTQLGLSAQEAQGLATGKAGAGVGVGFQSINDVVTAARQNIQAIGPELASQGINAAALVKALNNPTAYTREMEAIQQALHTRVGLYGKPQTGMYAQQGQGGGLSLYGPDKTAAYG